MTNKKIDWGTYTSGITWTGGNTTLTTGGTPWTTIAGATGLNTTTTTTTLAITAL